MIWTVAKKELRGYFNSAVALIFLGAFLAVTLYTFFWHEKFFARGLADLRPLFEWMPILLIILVSALSMRLWAEERRAGTLEVLLTLPVPRWKLVVGKFVAGMILIAVGLALTLGIPITVSMMGNLDWGPVIGGYLAALLLAAAYLVIGMCISAITDIQIIAFLGTALGCTITYVIGEVHLGELGRALGTGARFDSVARGVLDLRDLAYYASIVGIGIAVNVLLLGLMTWGKSQRARERRLGTLLAVGLIAANALALNIWLAPVRSARIDMTQDGAYSLSSATTRIVRNLDEQLLIRGYFSEKTHPQLAPLVPKLRDLLEEYRVAGEGKIRVEWIDPTEDDAAKREAKERFDIDPQPLRFATAIEKSIVNAYFAVAIQYGDQHEVLRLEELIQVRPLDIDKIDISLRNPEYQLTKSIKKAITSFSSVDALFASTTSKVTLTAYLTPKELPDNWKDAPEKLERVAQELKQDSGGKLEYRTVEPKDEAQMVELFQKYGLRPYADLLGGKQYYFALVLEVGDRIVRIVPPENLGDAGLKTSIIDGLKRAAPGFTRVVGIWTPQGGPPAPGMQGMPPPQTFNRIRQSLAGNYEVRDIPLAARVPDDVEVLVLAGPANLDAKAVQHVDQFVMRGGALVVLAGRYRLAPSEGLAVEKVTMGIEPLLAKWGITVLDQMVMDPKADTFPVPRNRDLGNGLVVRELQQLDYPLFVKLDGDQLAASVITGGLPGSVLHFASPVEAQDKVGDDVYTVEALLRSSSDAWLTTSTMVEPDFENYPNGFPPGGDDRKSHPLAVSVVGGFASGVAKDQPKDAKLDSAERLLEHSPPDTRIVVFGSSAFASDDILNLAQQLESDLALSNVMLVHNAVDWALADTDLLEIRAHTAAARAITIDPASRDNWRTINIVIAVFGLGLVIAFSYLRRGRVTPVVRGA
jgi:ABC-2 type transport system permease protein